MGGLDASALFSALRWRHHPSAYTPTPTLPHEGEGLSHRNARHMRLPCMHVGRGDRTRIDRMPPEVPAFRYAPAGMTVRSWCKTRCHPGMPSGISGTSGTKRLP
jgi:hypothetical protein